MVSCYILRRCNFQLRGFHFGLGAYDARASFSKITYVCNRIHKTSQHIVAGAGRKHKGNHTQENTILPPTLFVSFRKVFHMICKHFNGHLFVLVDFHSYNGFLLVSVDTNAHPFAPIEVNVCPMVLNGHSLTRTAYLFACSQMTQVIRIFVNSLLMPLI